MILIISVQELALKILYCYPSKIVVHRISLEFPKIS
jgi:hypothetical protein